jgi:hypothetical protein
MKIQRHEKFDAGGCELPALQLERSFRLGGQGLSGSKHRSIQKKPMISWLSDSTVENDEATLARSK